VEKAAKYSHSLIFSRMFIAQPEFKDASPDELVAFYKKIF
jgi:hypothetical protein